jgi:hypothetical protein
MVELPALNTPQFDWSRSRMPRLPQSVPPIFQPEVAAQAIVWAATHRRRELHVGWPTVTAIWGDKIAPGLLDRYPGPADVSKTRRSRSEPDPIIPDPASRAPP